MKPLGRIAGAGGLIREKEVERACTNVLDGRSKGRLLALLRRSEFDLQGVQVSLGNPVEVVWAVGRTEGRIVRA
jgi:hypothetical protein